MNLNVPVDMVQPFFFGAGDRQLWGGYDAPMSAPRGCAVVLCYPLGDEYIRAHRAYRQLASRLARHGFPVLRFDYYGTGDSAGEDTDATLATWGGDLALAIDEARRRSGVSKICLAGLRLGAALATLAAASRPDVTGLVLWEPVVNGAAYLSELEESHQRKLWYLLSKGVEEPRRGERPSELLGFSLGEAMYDEIGRLDLMALERVIAEQALIVEGAETPAATALRGKLEASGVAVRHEQVDGPAIWTEDPDKALVPNQVLQAMVNWMGEVFG